VFLDGSKKVYIRNRRFLKIGHKYRSKLYLKYYGNIEENEPPPERCNNREHVYKMVKNICIIYGKKRSDGTIRDRSTPPIEGVPFKKQSIFFQYLPYWLELEVPHAIDAMHVQKNVFESLIYLDGHTQVKGWSKSTERHGAAKCDARASSGT
jgi:hypothetical protein